MQPLLSENDKKGDLMGWTGYEPQYFKESGAVDRKKECDSYFLEGLNRRHFNVKKSVMKGNVYYAAVENLSKYDPVTRSYEDLKEEDKNTFGMVILTSVKNGMFYYKEMSEDVYPGYYDCPDSILDLLTKTDSLNALDWRTRCRENNESKRNDWLKKVPLGGKIVYTDHKGEEHILIKHAPGYQFKKWFWCEPKSRTYFRKSTVTSENSRIYKEEE